MLGCNRSLRADCVVHIGTPDLRSPIMRRPRVDREDDPASGKRSYDSRPRPRTLGAKILNLPAPHTVPGRRFLKKTLAKSHAIRRPHQNRWDCPKIPTSKCLCASRSSETIFGIPDIWAHAEKRSYRHFQRKASIRPVWNWFLEKSPEYNHAISTGGSGHAWLFPPD